MSIPSRWYSTCALEMLRNLVLISHLDVLCCVAREHALYDGPTERRLESRSVAMYSVSKSSVDTARCVGDLVECDVTRFGGGIVIEEDDDTGKDVEIEVEGYDPGHSGNVRSRICPTTMSDPPSTLQREWGTQTSTNFICHS